MEYSYFSLDKIKSGHFADMYINTMSKIAQEDIKDCNGDVEVAKQQNALKYATEKFIMDSVMPMFNSGITMDSIFAKEPDMSKVRTFADMYLGRYDIDSVRSDFSHLQEDMFNFIRDLKWETMNNLYQNTDMSFDSIKDFMIANNKEELSGVEFSGEDVVGHIDNMILNIATINAESVGKELDVEELKDVLAFDNDTWLKNPYEEKVEDTENELDEQGPDEEPVDDPDGRDA